MILTDVNILLYAFRKDASDHRRYQEWLSSAINSPSPYGMSPQVLCSFVRITTNPRIFFQPTPLNEALEFCRAVLTQSNCQAIHPGERHWPIFAELCSRVKASGNLVQDAWFAAMAIENGCEWITTDRDYARFPGLLWRFPF